MRTRHNVIAYVFYFASSNLEKHPATQTFRAALLGLTLGAFLTLSGSNEAHAQVPRSISYQGFLVKNNEPVNGEVDLHLKIYNAGGEILYDETDNQVPVNHGLMNVLLGGNAGILPTNLHFDEQYYLGIEVDNTGEATPRTPFVSAPYALNSQTVGGISASVTPQPGMLLPLDKNGRIPRNVMPISGEYISRINDISGDSTGGIRIVSSDPNTLRVTNDANNNRIILTVVPASESGVVTANLLTGSGANKYSGSVAIPQNALFMQIPYTGVTSNSNVVVSVNDPAGQTNQVSVGAISPGVGFNVFFSGYYPTDTGKLNYLVIN